MSHQHYISFPSRLVNNILIKFQIPLASDWYKNGRNIYQRQTNGFMIMMMMNLLENGIFIGCLKFIITLDGQLLIMEHVSGPKKNNMRRAH
jgi:hypothetical protein